MTTSTNAITYVVIGALLVLGGMYAFTDVFEEKEAASISFGDKELKIKTE